MMLDYKNYSDTIGFPRTWKARREVGARVARLFAVEGHPVRIGLALADARPEVAVGVARVRVIAVD